MPQEYDIIVIGTGAGMVVAAQAAAVGKKTAIIEKGPIGGTCLNRGCIPSKMLIYPAETLSRLEEADRYDLSVPDGARIRFSALMRRIGETVGDLSAKQLKKLKSSDTVSLYQGKAFFVDNYTLQIGGDLITAPVICIASGAAPRIPDIPGLAQTPYMTSTEALRREDLPGRLLVIGGGTTAVELGFAYAAAGARVDVLVRSRVLRTFDDDIREEFRRVFGRRHMVHEGCSPVRVSHDGNGFTVRYRTEHDEDKSMQADALLVAAGVEPQTAHLGLEHTDIQTDGKGFVIVNDYLETHVKQVYALGDVVGNYFYRHTANYEAYYLARRLFSGEQKPLVYGPVPYAVFSQPQVAGVGASESRLRAEGVDYIAGKALYRDSTPGMIRETPDGFAKLLFEKATRRLVGAHIVGEEAADIIHMCIPAIKKNSTFDDMLDLIYIHPALCEVIRDAARDAASQW